MRTHQFTVESNGKIYDCERTFTGERVFRQSVHVIGVGSKDDPASYGARCHPPSSMAGIAKLIAHEIIREAGR